MSSDNRQKRGKTTRLDIIQIARRLFSEHGYHATGLSDIQAVTGLTKGAFYHHFRSKEELAMAVLETARCDYAECLIGPAMGEATPGRQIIALLDRSLKLNADPEWRNCQMMATLCAELTGENGRLREVVRTMLSNMIELWRGQISAAQESGEVDRQIDAKLWAQWIMQTIIGTLLSRKLGTLQVPAADVFEQIKRLLLKPSVFDAASRPQPQKN